VALRIPASVPMVDDLPVIDVAPFATGAPLPCAAAATQALHLDACLREIGFVLVTGHGLDPAVKAGMLDAARAFFALPAEVKQAIAIGNSPCHRGYVALATETLDDANTLAGDLKETLDTGTEHGPDHPEVVAGTPLHGPNQFPDLPGFREAWERYRAQAVEASLRVQRGLATALGLDPHFFEAIDGETMYHLRLVHYPPAERVTPEPGQLGCGTHTDYGTITVLADDGVGGLQVRGRDGSWLDVRVPDDHLVVNLGDLMAIWTNDRWVSNPHRVVNPPGRDRYSIPLFVTPPFHAWITALPGCVADGDRPHHAPVQAGPYLLGRFDGTHAYRNPLLEEHNRSALPD
jgi:isopenicillin N synthase-like dioxygenase